jgi:chitinase
LPATSSNLIYSAYKDISISANWNNSVISTVVTGNFVPLVQLASQTPAITWAFATGECGNETWGGLAATAVAGANVSAWAAAKKPYIISTGGAAGVFSCGSDAGFSAFLDHYMSASMLGVDFDIEAGQSQAQVDALIARVKAAQKNSKYKNLRFSFTIATLGGNSPQSLGGAGIMVMQSIKQAGLTNYYINLMAMDYGSATATNCTQATDGSCSMGLSANQAAINLHQYYNVPYSQIELTPMIGGNDTQDETFSLADVDTVTAFAKRMGLGGVHFWSLDRDRDCAPGYASPTCNSYGQAGNLGFVQRFAKGLQ